jgi:NADH-quinone oxidoreductase subunit G
MADDAATATDAPDAQPEEKKSTFTVTVDGRAFEADPGQLLIAAAEEHGTYIPRFCWHPRMKPVGMCRMCLVEVEGPRGKALQPACMLPVADGMVVDTQSDTVKKVQDGVLEFLLINHPLDCPVCDRGGECPLQDQTLTFGPGESRLVEEKRHFEKPIPISDLVMLDRERCIQCARCTRFADEVAGDPLIQFVDRGNQIQVLTFPDDPFTSYFSGNTVQICPVGALTATPYRFRARPWDLDQVESTCTSCAVGCRVVVQSSSDRIVRKLGIDSDPVNHGWLCDKGRFDYEYASSPERLGAPLVRRPGSGSTDELVEVSWGEALSAAADGIKKALDVHGPGAVAVLGGSRLTNEDAYAWSKFARTCLGTDNVDAQLGDGLPADVVLGLPRATIDEACRAKTVLLLAPDLKEELPVLYLRLREAAVERGACLVELTPQATGLTRYAALSLGYRPGEVGALARSLTADGPVVAAGGIGAADIQRARELVAAGDVVVVLGRPSVAESAESVADAVGALAAIPGVKFLSALRRGNVHGALDMGLAPGMLPGRVTFADGRQWFADGWGSLPEDTGMDATGILSAAAEGRIQALVLLGADPMTDFPDRSLARRALAGAGFVVAVDCFLTDSSRQADVVLAAATWGEKDGTTTNLEGRVSRLGHKVTSPGTAHAEWMMAVELAWRLGGDLGFDSLDGVWREIERLAPSHGGLTLDLLRSPRHRDGIVVPVAPEGPPPASGALPEEAGQIGHASQMRGDPDSVQSATTEVGPAGTEEHGERSAAPAPDAEPAVGDPDASPATQAPIGAASPAGGIGPTRPRLVAFRGGDAPATVPAIDAYSLRLVSGRSLYDQGVTVQQSPALAHLATGTTLNANPYDLDRLGVTTGGQVRVTSSRASMVLTVCADAGVPRGSASITFNQPGEGAADLIDATAPVTDVRVETVNG